VRTVLAGPFEELAPSRDEAAGDAKAEALRYADDAARPLLVALLGAGAAVPTVGLELGEPVVGELALAWAEAKLGLALDASPKEVESMRALGWSVVAAEQRDAVALERALVSLATALGVDVGDDDPQAAEEEGDD
jgi:hypothetical protein